MGGGGKALRRFFAFGGGKDRSIEVQNALGVRPPVCPHSSQTQAIEMYDSLCAFQPQRTHTITRLALWLLLPAKGVVVDKQVKKRSAGLLHAPCSALDGAITALSRRVGSFGSGIAMCDGHWSATSSTALPCACSSHAGMAHEREDKQTWRHTMQSRVWMPSTVLSNAAL